MDYFDYKLIADSLEKAIKEFEQKIAEQGAVTNARDEEHLADLKLRLKRTKMTMRSF